MEEWTHLVIETEQIVLARENMIYQEDAIDFLKITESQFEEVCFDLLLRLGYQALVWRQGGADSGRDIEGKFTIINPLIGTFAEKWFFECKRYKNAVPPSELNSKIAWADAEKTEHLVFFVSSYLSNDTRIWLEKISEGKRYSVHVVEGKQLKKLLLGFPTIIERYFLNEYEKLLLESQENWLLHDIFPSSEALVTLAENLDPARLSTHELAFFCCAAEFVAVQLDEWIMENVPFDLDPFYRRLAIPSGPSETLLGQEPMFMTVDIALGTSLYTSSLDRYLVAHLSLGAGTEYRRALYTLVGNDEGEGIEILIESTSDFPTKVRYIEKDARKEFIHVNELLSAHRAN